MTLPTLIILNPHADSGRAQHVWQRIEAQVTEKIGHFELAITQSPDDVYRHLAQAYTQGIRRVIGIGGDGTNNSLVDAIAQLQDKHPDYETITLGNLPIGTGRDWARSQGIPLNIGDAITRVSEANPTSVDVGQIELDGVKKRYFLNIASGGLGGDVDKRVNSVQKRRPWTFLRATVAAILTHQPQHIEVKLDDKTWFDHETMIVVIANGTTFGHGMHIAPLASINDGLFDVITLKSASRLQLLRLLWLVYAGQHLKHKQVMFDRAHTVEIICHDGQLALDIDGEFSDANHLKFTVKPGLLQMLI